MAVLRAAQLWIGPVPPNVRLARPLPFGPEIPEPPEVTPYAAHLYTCPEGKKAIVRTMTFTLDQNQTATGATMAVWLRPTGQSSEWKVFWHWWYQGSTGESLSWAYHRTWNGQLVLKPGDQLRSSHSAQGNMHTMGSGHELPLQSGG